MKPLPRRLTIRRCLRCGNKGLIRVNYHSGEPFDVGICECQAGQHWRTAGEDAIRARLLLADENRVALLEDFEGEDFAVTPTVVEDFTAAGKVGKRAKL